MKFINFIIKAIFVIVIILAIIFGFFVYSNVNGETKNNEKIEKEIDYLDTKTINLINKLNNINLENYKISVSTVQEEGKGASGGSSSGSSSSEEGMGQSAESQESSSKEGSSGSPGENEPEQSSENKQEVTITKMERELIVDNNGEINWDLIQGETEALYSVWATIVLDLNSIGVDSNKIVDFSNTLDEVLNSAKNKDKEGTSANIARLYSFLPEFLKSTEVEETKKNIIQTKSYILNAYSNMDAENIDGVETEIKNAEDAFTKVVNNISKENDQRKFNINKAYILIEEIKNSLSEEKSGIFYLKYKNVIEELNSLM